MVPVLITFCFAARAETTGAALRPTERFGVCGVALRDAMLRADVVGAGDSFCCVDD